MTPTGSLDVLITQVPSNRCRKTLLPTVHEHCLPGSIFCSDGWKAYNKLREHSELEGVDHFSVNHPENFVDSESAGTYTNNREGVWRQCKDFLLSFGLNQHTYVHILELSVSTDIANSKNSTCSFIFSNVLAKFIHLL